MKKLVITTVADPMMGMLWETWPTMRKLEPHYGEQLEFKFLSPRGANRQHADLYGW